MSSRRPAEDRPGTGGRSGEGPRSGAASRRAARVPANYELTLGMTSVDQSQPGTAVWAMVAADHMANPVGVVQGGFLSAFAVGAMSSATVTGQRRRPAPAAGRELKISFLRSATIGETLTCTARVIGVGRRVTFVEAEITDSAHRLVAKASSTYHLTQRDEAD